MELNKMAILKFELNQLLKGGFIIPMNNTQWMLLVVIVMKHGGK